MGMASRDRARPTLFAMTRFKMPGIGFNIAAHNNTLIIRTYIRYRQFARPAIRITIAGLRFKMFDAGDPNYGRAPGQVRSGDDLSILPVMGRRRST
jgi:hypothetical protein